MRIDTKGWKEFLLSDYFDICPGKYHSQDEYEEGKTPYVSASNTNNGVGSYIDLQPDFKGNCIVTGKIGCTAFYQPDPFCATSDVNVFIPKFAMNDMIGTFITSVINYDQNYRWDYGRQCRVGNSKKITIRLPSKDDQPDWQYMEDYMKTLHWKAITSNVRKTAAEIDTTQWKEFKLNELFKIQRGNGLSKVELTEDANGVNFVSRQSYDNGVSGAVEQIEDIDPFETGSITVALGGEFLGSSFVQLKPFYTGAHMAVLTPLDETMTFFSKLFICTLIRFESKVKYCAFGRELDTHVDNEVSIKLPANSKGLPDWSTIDAYMKGLKYSDKV